MLSLACFKRTHLANLSEMYRHSQADLEYASLVGFGWFLKNTTPENDPMAHLAAASDTTEA
jgi:hypothetical protein